MARTPSPPGGVGPPAAPPGEEELDFGGGADPRQGLDLENLPGVTRVTQLELETPQGAPAAEHTDHPAWGGYVTLGVVALVVVMLIVGLVSSKVIWELAAVLIPVAVVLTLAMVGLAILALPRKSPGNNNPKNPPEEEEEEEPHGSP